MWHTEVPNYRPCFIHRDFHPGNILWVRGRCSEIVDWPNACRGPAGCDIAHCRENLMWLGGDYAADSFQAQYKHITATSHHPDWEIASTLEHGPSGWTHQGIVRARRLVWRGCSANSAASKSASDSKLDTTAWALLGWNHARAAPFYWDRRRPDRSPLRTPAREADRRWRGRRGCPGG